MTEETIGPVAFDTPSEVPETPEQQRERLTALREKLKAEREDIRNRTAIAMGLVSFFTWVRTPFKNFVMLHAFPNRAQHRRNLGIQKEVTRRLKEARKPEKVSRVTLAQKRALARRVEPAIDISEESPNE